LPVSEYGQATGTQPRILRNAKVKGTIEIAAKPKRDFHPNTEESTDSKKSGEFNIYLEQQNNTVLSNRFSLSNLSSSKVATTLQNSAKESPLLQTSSPA
jgi:hypothetical protein